MVRLSSEGRGFPARRNFWTDTIFFRTPARHIRAGWLRPPPRFSPAAKVP
jgi:hypothetical protein